MPDTFGPQTSPETLVRSGVAGDVLGHVTPQRVGQLRRLGHIRGYLVGGFWFYDRAELEQVQRVRDRRNALRTASRRG